MTNLLNKEPVKIRVGLGAVVLLESHVRYFCGIPDAFSCASGANTAPQWTAGTSHPIDSDTSINLGGVNLDQCHVRGQAPTFSAIFPVSCDSPDVGYALYPNQGSAPIHPGPW